MVDVTKFADKPELYYCMKCKAVGVTTKLTGRIYLPDPKTGKTKVPSDAEEWMQCPTCGDLIHRSQLTGTSTMNVDSDYELADTAYDFGKVVIQHAGPESRKFDRSPDQRKAKRKKSKRFIQDEIKDKDIAKEIKEGGEIIHYQTSKA
jgi:acetyl-CoA carboxylase beta subunit